MLYPLPYLFFIAVLGVLALLVHQRKDDKQFCQYVTWSAIVIYVLFFGLRGFVAHDWMNYYPSFENTDWYDIANYQLGKSDEFGWILFQLLCKAIFDNFHFMVFVHSIICIFLLYNFIRRYTENICLVLILYFAFDGFVLSLNLMRNVLSLLIFCNAIPYLINRKALQYYLMCILAFCFHYSSVVFFPLYFFMHLKNNKWVFGGISLFFVAVYFSNIPVFLTLFKLSGIGGAFVEKKVEAYTDLSSHLHVSIGLLERLLTLVLFFCYYDKLCGMRKENRLFLNAFLVYLFSAFLFSEFSEISKRICILFDFCYWILWMDLIKCFYYRNNRILFISFVSLYCLIKIAVPMINQPVYQYDNFMFGDIKSYQERRYIFEKTFDEQN